MPAATLSEPARDDAPASADAASRARVRERIERQQAMLARAAEVAANTIEAIDDLVTAIRTQRDPAEQDASGVTPLAPAIARRKILDDLGLTLHRATRAMRLTFLLQDKLDKDLERLSWIDECDARDAKPSSAPARPVRRVELVIGATALSKQAGDTEKQRSERLGRMTETIERLNEDDHFGDLLRGPVSEAIGYIHEQLGVPPDWEALAETDWAREEIASGKIGRPLKAVVHPPPTGPDGEPLVEGVDFFRYIIPPLPPQKPPRRSG